MQVAGILRSGNLSGASIKCKIKMEEIDGEDYGEESDEDEQNLDTTQQVADTKGAKKNVDDEGEDNGNRLRRF